MSTQSGIIRFFLSPILFWIAVLVVGSYFMVSFDAKIMREAREKDSLVDYAKTVFSAAQLGYINKGIDIAGGTYLVLGVEVEKALDNRLQLESRSLDSLFEENEMRILPEKTGVKGDKIELVFDDENAAKVCLNLLREHRAASLKVSRSGMIVSAGLTPEVERSIRTGSVEQAVNVLSNRLGGYGVEGIIVQQHGERQIVIQLPGIDDPERVKKVVTQTAHLEFKVVEASSGSYDALLDKFDGELPSDKMIIPGKSEKGSQARQFFLVSAFPDMTGDRIVDSKVEFDQYGRSVVGFRLDGAGAREFADITSNNVGRQLGIIIDNIMYSYPNIKDPITGGSGTISGSFTQKEALDLSIVLKSGSLSAPLKFEQESRVGASLGQDSVAKGILSCLVALVLLFFFSLFYYKIPGFFAILAILYNLFLILIFLSYFGATLTLPGIAGMVVSIGMGIDASILIYEKIKEEIAKGASTRNAVNSGFNGMMAVILDSNITTFLTGLVLFQFGGPAVKGFAVTLMAGIVATLLAGIYFLKSLFSFTFDGLGVKSLKF